MNFIKKITIIVLIFLLGISQVRGQQNLELKDAINIALRNSLGIELARNNVDANTILNSYGVAGGLPTLNAAAVDNKTFAKINQKYSDASRNAKTTASTNTITAGVTASMILFNGMRVVSTKKRLEELESQSQQVLNSQVQNTIAQVMTTYFDIIRQQSYAKTILKSIDVSQKRLDILLTQQSVGMANNADVFQARLDLNALSQSLLSQQLIIDQAKTDLLTLLTLKADSLIYVDDTIIVDRSIKLDSVVAHLSDNADIIAADQQIRINELIVKETAAQRYPLLRFVAGYNYNRVQNSAGFNLLNQSSGPTVGLNLAVPIYNGGAYKRQQEAAEINTKNAEVQKQSLIRDYTAGAVKMYQAYANSLVQLATEQQNYGLAQQLLDLVMQKYQLRQATIIDVREAQKSFEDAGYRLVNLEFAAKSAEIELKRLSNSLKF